MSKEYEKPKKENLAKLVLYLSKYFFKYVLHIA